MMSAVNDRLTCSMRMYGMDTRVMSGSVISVGTPFITKEKVTVTGSAPSTSMPESAMVNPRMKLRVVCEASA